MTQKETIWPITDNVLCFHRSYEWLFLQSYGCMKSNIVDKVIGNVLTEGYMIYATSLSYHRLLFLFLPSCPRLMNVVRFRSFKG